MVHITYDINPEESQERRAHMRSTSSVAKSFTPPPVHKKSGPKPTRAVVPEHARYLIVAEVICVAASYATQTAVGQYIILVSSAVVFDIEPSATERELS